MTSFPGGSSSAATDWTSATPYRGQHDRHYGASPSALLIWAHAADGYHVCRVPGGGRSRLGLPVGAARQLPLSRLTPVKITAMIEPQRT